MEYMTNQEMIDLAFGVPANEYNCYSLIGEIAERVARFNDYNDPVSWGQRYAVSFSICAGYISVMVMDMLKPKEGGIAIYYRLAKEDDAMALNEVLEMVIFLAKELTV